MTSVTERRRRAADRTREDILEAAARAFARTSYQSATMRDIAREAGYTAAALYNYFESKQEILGALVKLVIDDFLRVFEEPIPPGLEFQQRLHLLVRRIVDQAERRRELFLILVSMAQANQHPRPSKSHPHPLQTLQKTQHRLARWFTENATTQELGGHSADDVARFFFGVTHAFMSDWMVKGTPSGELVHRAELMVDFFLHGVSGEDRKPTATKKRGANA
jgi:AcrR family transcriptional regulator